MTLTELGADVLARNLEMLKATLADFSDADMLVRPAPAANHAAWQLGHLVTSEAHLVNAFAPGAIPEPPADFTRRFAKEAARVDDAAAFPKKDEILQQFANVRGATIRWVKTLAPQDLGRTGPERLQRFAPDVAHLITALPNHVMMHVGQFQVIRRTLGKPVLF
jgi:hypothetical protein